MTPTSTKNWAGVPNWYEIWFDSPFYHLLYQDRDEEEARRFIDRLLQRLAYQPPARVLDLACGKGRYSRYLASLGFDVTGIDLSEQSIAYARRSERENLSFYRHDMRHVFRINYFDYIFNFFTSFGYFPAEREDMKVLRNVHAGLRRGGGFVLDFFNSAYVIDHLTGHIHKEIQDVHFDIDKRIEGRFVVKDIRFAARGCAYFFQERVRLYRLADFERMFGEAGLRIRDIFGDYGLGAFDEARSPRIILVAEKP